MRGFADRDGVLIPRTAPDKTAAETAATARRPRPPSPPAAAGAGRRRTWWPSCRTTSSAGRPTTAHSSSAGSAVWPGWAAGWDWGARKVVRRFAGPGWHHLAAVAGGKPGVHGAAPGAAGAAHRPRRPARAIASPVPGRCSGRSTSPGWGMGFIMVELVLIQRFNLLSRLPDLRAVGGAVHHPARQRGGQPAGRSGGIRAAAVPGARWGWAWACPAFAVMLPSVLEWARSAALAGRILLVRDGRDAPRRWRWGCRFRRACAGCARSRLRLVPWAWAVNGGASVLGLGHGGGHLHDLRLSAPRSSRARWPTAVALAAAAALARSPATVTPRRTHEPSACLIGHGPGWRWSWWRRWR